MIRNRTRLLITDLDNTLYDWVTFFALSFSAMVRELEVLLNVSEEELLDEFREVNRGYGTSEQPFAVFDLPSVRKAFPGATPAELRTRLDPALHAFNSVRNRELVLYPGVRETLEVLAARGVSLVAHTEATSANAYFRLTKLGIASYFRHLYVLSGRPVRHPDPERAAALAPPDSLVTPLPPNERKPNPDVVIDICRQEAVDLADAVYVGDSLTKDVGMALAAGVTAAWARYGTVYDKAHWDLLVRITHWTDEDVRREAELRRLPLRAPHVILESFDELVPLFGLPPRPILTSAGTPRHR